MLGNYEGCRNSNNKNTFIEEGAVVSGVATIGQIEVGITSILSSGIITATSTSGVVTYYGDGVNLLNLTDISMD